MATSYTYKPIVIDGLVTYIDSFNHKSYLPGSTYSQDIVGQFVGDLNNDGKKDIFFGGSQGKLAAIYLQNEKGFSKKAFNSIYLDSIYEDASAVIGDFNGDKKRKSYGKFFALTVFAPFISFITILFASQNKYSIYLGIAVFFYLAIKSCPLLFNNIFFSKFEKIFFL